MSTHTSREKRTSPKSAPRKMATPVTRRVRPDSGEAFLHDPTESKPHVHSNDSLAQLFGEEFVQSATSGEASHFDDTDDTITEELGGPFIVSTAADEIAETEPETPDATVEPFPLPHRKQLKAN